MVSSNAISLIDIEDSSLANSVFDDVPFIMNLFVV